MGQAPELIEKRLHDDLLGLDERLRDDKFCTELYRALAGNRWRRAGSEPELSLSWARAEELVNDLREHVSRAPLALRQTGREGEIPAVVRQELGRLGWRAARLPRRDPDRLRHEDEGASNEGPSRQPEWERVAHEQADAEIARRYGIG